MQTRWASPENPRALPGGGGRAGGGRKGRPSVRLPSGKTLVLAEEGAGVSGTVRRIWLTLENRSPEMLRGVRLDFFWDGAETPAVSAPLGDFFQSGLGRMTVFENALFSSPEGRSFCTIAPMPFQSGMKLTLTNETRTDIALLFYDVNYTIGDAHNENTRYFHAHFRCENPTVLRRDYEILPCLSGRGQFLGATMSVTCDRETYGATWWGEGEVKMYLDTDTTHPTLCGTGTEDYLGTAWAQGTFCHAFQGCTIADEEIGAFCFYRFHVPDPVYFAQSLRVTIQQIGHAFGDGLTALQTRAAFRREVIYAANDAPALTPADFDASPPSGLLFERSDDWASCAYFLLDTPENGLPPLAPLAERTKGL